MHMAPSSRPPSEPPHDIGDVFIHAKNPPWSKEKEKVLCWGRTTTCLATRGRTSGRS